MFVSKVVAFGRDIILTSCYGATYISDAFLVSISIPTVLFSGVVTALYTCYIPFYKEMQEKNKAKVRSFNGNLITVVFILSCVLIGFCWLFDDAILKVFAVGFDAAAFQLAKEMFHIMALVMVFMGITYILQGYLQANESFYLVGAMTIPTNLIIAFSIWFSSNDTLLYMAWGTVLGYAVYIPYFGIPAYKKGFRFRPNINLHDEDMKRILFMIIPVFVGQIIFEINSMVDKSVASLLPAGGITALDYSFKVMSMIHASLVAPIATIIYPRFAGYVVEEKEADLKRVLTTVLRMVEIVVFPVVGGVIVLAKPIIELLFFRGAFTSEAVQLTSESLIAYAGCAIPISLRIICEKVFYARKETKITMLNSMGGIAVNIILDIVLVRSLAHVGLALATTVSSFVTLLLFLLSLHRRIGNFGGREILLTGCKAGIGALIMSLCLVFLNQVMGTWGIILRLVVSVTTGTVIYALVMVILQEKLLINYVKTRRKR